MADFTALKNQIIAAIYSNSSQAISGDILQTQLLDMVDAINGTKQDVIDGYVFGGILRPDDVKTGIPDTQGTLFLAIGAGDYTLNDDTITLVGGASDIFVITYDGDGTINHERLVEFDNTPQSGSQNPVTSGGIFSAIEHAKGAAGLAEALLDTDSEGAEQEFSLRKSGGDGGAYFRRLLGNTKAFNQMVQAGASTTALSLTLTNNGDGSISITGTADTTTNLTISTLFARATGSRYFCSVGAPIGASQQVSVGGTPFSAGATMGIYTASATGNVSMAISVVSGETYNLKLWPVVIDLTAMQDNSTTPEEFREKYPLLYYAYGRKLIHNKVAKVITKGANQWDEVWEGGAISAITGGNMPDAECVRSKNYIPIFAGKNYYLASISNVSVRVIFYASDHTIISSPASSETTNAEFATPANAAFMRFYFRRAADPTYRDEVCVNISDAEINGTYFPYWERELAFDITNQEDTDGNKPFAEGMMSAGSAADYANEVGGAKVMGVVDLGDYTYTKGGTPSFFYFKLNDAKAPTADTIQANIICSGYTAYSRSAIDDKGICINSSGYVLIHDSALDNLSADDFKTAMDGVKLVYEKATPVPFTWKEPLNTGIKVSKYGTEETTPAQTENIDNAPFRAVTTYSISVANLVAALSALGNRGGAKGSLGSGNQEENPENEELIPEEENPKEEEIPVVEPEVQNKR